MGSTAILTAAGSGIGAAIARRLAGDGWNVAILSPSGRGEALARELGGIGVTGSNQDDAALARLVEEAMARWGGLHAVINSAGHGPKGPLLAISDEDWHHALDTYLLNVVRVARHVTPVLQRGGGGTIVNISSYAARDPDPGYPTSSVVRAGLSAFTRLYAREHARDNIRMNNLLPGFIDSLPEREENHRRIPMARYGRTTEIAGTVAWLVSPEAGYVTGQDIVADGGVSRGL